MNKFTEIADSFLDTFSGVSINSELSKFAKEQGLNLNEHQRLVEEVNVSMFLRKLDTNTHYNDFELAEPVKPMTMEPIESIENQAIVKTASQSSGIKITHDMFDISKKTSGSTLPSNYDSSSSDHEMQVQSLLRKEAHIRNEHARRRIEEDTGVRVVARQADIAAENKKLLKVANQSAGSTKAIVRELCSKNLVKTAEDIVDRCKYNTSEIASAKMGLLSKEAKESVGSAMGALDKLLIIPSAAGTIVSKVAENVVKKPKRTAVLSSGGILAYNVPENAEKARVEMMLKTRQGE